MPSVFRRHRSTVGLDVGSGYVKIALVDHSGDQPELTYAGYAPMAPDAIVEGEIMDPQLVASTIRSLLSESGIKPRRVVVSVGGRDVIVKKIQMQRMTAAEAREVIRWEAEQYVPFDMDHVLLDFQILDPGEGGLQMDVLLVAAKRELVDQRVAILRDAGITPAVVDVDAFALHNAFEFNYPQAMQGTVALVNVGHELSALNLLQDGAPVLTRELPFGSRRLRENLRRSHAMSSDEAEQALAGNPATAEQAREVVYQGGDELAASIERAAVFAATTEWAGEGLGKVFLCGGGARIPGLLDAVADRLGVRTELANPLHLLRVRSGATARFPVDELATMLMLPIGLALRAA